VLGGLGCAALSISPALSAIEDTVRFGILNFGTALWEVDVIGRHRLDGQNGFSLQALQLASSEAAKVALQAGAVDIIVSDWVWVARQRADGNGLAFLPYSRAVGALELPQGSPIQTLGDLAGKRLGVAGGPMDKSWLLLRALAVRELDKDLAEIVEPVFGAPPLIMHELEAGRLDAALTFWNFAAQMEARGTRPLLTVSDMLVRLGISSDVPLLGYVFRDEWARGNPALIDRFSACSRAAKAILANSDEEWRALEPLLGTDDSGVKLRLRDGYRAGIPQNWAQREKDDAARLFLMLAEIGGEQLVGSAHSLDPATFWASAEL